MPRAKRIPKEQPKKAKGKNNVKNKEPDPPVKQVPDSSNSPDPLTHMADALSRMEQANVTMLDRIQRLEELRSSTPRNSPIHSRSRESRHTSRSRKRQDTFTSTAQGAPNLQQLRGDGALASQVAQLLASYENQAEGNVLRGKSVRTKPGRLCTAENSAIPPHLRWPNEGFVAPGSDKGVTFIN